MQALPVEPIEDAGFRGLGQGGMSLTDDRRLPEIRTADHHLSAGECFDTRQNYSRRLDKRPRVEGSPVRLSEVVEQVRMIVCCCVVMDRGYHDRSLSQGPPADHSHAGG